MDNSQTSLPQERIDVIIDPLKRFLHIESASGVVLLIATAAALAIANSDWSEAFHTFWHTTIGFRIGSFQLDLSLAHWVNDLLMAIFFYVVGLEVKREMVLGELRDPKRAALPLAAALGGMVVPALIYLVLQKGTPGENGWGIPMATDIAFVVGCLAILGKRVPSGLRVMLLSLAIADDIGAILVIAIGYTDTIHLGPLFFSVGCIAVIVVLMKIGVRNGFIYVCVSLLVWFGFHESGVHATIAGVILGLFTPTKSWVSQSAFSSVVENTMDFLQGEEPVDKYHRVAKLREMEQATRKSISPLERTEVILHPWVGFAIMPIFALANAGVRIDATSFTEPVAVAVALGLLVGKPVGILLFSWFGCAIGLAKLPDGVSWKGVLGGGFLAGIGFTMALFVAGLALDEPFLSTSKVGILAGSALSAIIGLLILRYWQKPATSYNQID